MSESTLEALRRANMENEHAALRRAIIEAAVNKANAYTRREAVDEGPCMEALWNAVDAARKAGVVLP